MESKDVKKKSSLKEFFKNQKKTLPVKIVILSYSGGAVCVFAFLVLQMRSIGLTINEIAILYLIVPVGSLLGPIVSGLVADKVGRYERIFVVNVILGAICCNSYLIIPHYEQSKIYYSCDQGVMSIAYNDCNECIQTLIQKNQSLFDVEPLALKNCEPCVENEYNNIVNCTEDRISTHFCPAFSSTDDILVDLAMQNSSSVCTISVSSASQANMTFVDSKKKCYKTKTCDYACDIPEDVQQCFPKPLMTNTFIYTGIIVFAANFFISAAFTILDATILQVAKEQNASIGRQKIMSMLGFGLTPLLAGVLIDVHSKRVGYKSYFSAFMLANALMACACIFALNVNMKVDRNKTGILKDLKKLVTSLEVDLFLLLVLVLGCNFGFIESYVFIYLQSLGAPSFLLGLTMTVGCLSSIPMLFCADWLEKKLGRHGIFLICFTAYAIRMVGYSFIVNPWMCLIFELFESITYQLMWVTCLKICPLLAPRGLLATMTGLMGSIHYSVGKGIGGFVGGRFINRFGMRNAFRIFGGIALAGGVFYIIIHYAFFKRIFEQKEQEMAEERKAAKELEEGKRMLPEEKCPSYNDISYQDNRRGSSDKQRNEHTKEQTNSKDFLTPANNLSGSTPFLHNADDLGRHEMKYLSISENNLKT